MKEISDEITVRKRKRKARLTYVFYKLLWVIPLDHKKIVFTAFEGNGGFCCNPRYIAEEILRRGNRYHIIWLVNDMNRQFPKGIKKVKNSFLRRAYHLATAKVWVDNSRKAFGTAKRKNQLYIQTWHAALGLKPVGKFRGELFPKIACLISRYDSRLADYVISNSEWCTKRYPKMLLYDGEIIKTGSPRCDILMTKREQIYKEIRTRYGIPQKAKIVMFSPTFRGGSQKGERQVFSETPTLDFKRLIKTLEEKFEGEWYILLRLHPQLAVSYKEMPLQDRLKHMLDVSQADDMNELMAAADVFITDYSSSAFDAINMYLPVFLYADDLSEYIEERGKLMWNMRRLPFSVAETNNELMENIKKFDPDKYKEDIFLFLQHHGVLEDGQASKRVADIIEDYINGAV